VGHSAEDQVGGGANRVQDGRVKVFAWRTDTGCVGRGVAILFGSVMDDVARERVAGAIALSLSAAAVCPPPRRERQSQPAAGRIPQGYPAIANDAHVARSARFPLRPTLTRGRSHG
jgi:hypothetical protein